MLSASKATAFVPRARRFESARTIVVTLAVLSLSSCVADVDAVADRWLTQAERDYGPAFLALVQASEFDAARRYVDSAVLSEVSDSVWSTLSEGLQGARLDSLRLTSLNVRTDGDIRTIQLGYEAPGNGRWVMVNLEARATRLVWFRAQHNDLSLVEMNAFSNASATMSHVLMLLWALSAAAAVLIAAIRSIRSRMPNGWVWAVLSFFVVGRVNLDWTSGATAGNLLTVWIPPVTWSKAGPAAPWILGVGIPLFAMIAYRKARRWELNPQPSNSEIGSWSVLRSTPEGGELRVATHMTRELAEQHAQQLRSAGLEHRYWVEGSSSAV